MDYKAEYEKLLAAIKAHRDQKADDRCWLDDRQLYALAGLPDGYDPHVGDKFEMVKNCIRFVERRCVEGSWPTYKELEERIQKLQDVIKSCCQCRFQNGFPKEECHYHQCQRFVRLSNGDPSDVLLIEHVNALEEENERLRQLLKGNTP